MRIKLILILLLTLSALLIGACSTSQGYNPPAPSGGGCGVSSVNTIATVCSASSINSVSVG